MPSWQLLRRLGRAHVLTVFFNSVAGKQLEAKWKAEAQGGLRQRLPNANDAVYKVIWATSEELLSMVQVDQPWKRSAAATTPSGSVLGALELVAINKKALLLEWV